MDTNYFLHDSNARSDERVLNLRMHHGAAGYGVYFMILELMRDSSEYRCLKDYNTIAFELRVDASLVKAVVENYGLFVFTDDGKYFYSKPFSKRMNSMDKAHKRRVIAGRKGGTARWEKIESTANPEDYFSDIRIPDSRSAKSFCKQFSVNHDMLVRKLDAFLLDSQCRGTSHLNKRDALSHFTDWLRINIETEIIRSNEPRTDNISTAKRRGIPEANNQVSDYEGSF